MTPNDIELAGPDAEIRRILDQLLANDETITVRAVSRLHPTIKHASSFTRNEARAALIAEFQKKQAEWRAWNRRKDKTGKVELAQSLVFRDLRIADLERQVEILTASHVAMIRLVGELGGMSKWLKLFDGYKEIQETLAKLGALPPAAAVTPNGVSGRKTSRIAPVKI